MLAASSASGSSQYLLARTRHVSASLICACIVLTHRSIRSWLSTRDVKPRVKMTKIYCYQIRIDNLKGGARFWGIGPTGHWSQGQWFQGEFVLGRLVPRGFVPEVSIPGKMPLGQNLLRRLALGWNPLGINAPRDQYPRIKWIYLLN